MAELMRQDPILFYAEIPLYEDELHDNGASHLLVRIVRHSFLRFGLFSHSDTAARDAYMYIHLATLHTEGRQRSVPYI